MIKEDCTEHVRKVILGVLTIHEGYHYGYKTLTLATYFDVSLSGLPWFGFGEGLAEINKYTLIELLTLLLTRIVVCAELPLKSE